MEVCGDEETIVVRPFLQNKAGHWVLQERFTKETVHKSDILHGPFLLREDGKLPKDTQRIILERLKETQSLANRCLSARRKKAKLQK